jgi:hypothetical protein
VLLMIMDFLPELSAMMQKAMQLQAQVRPQTHKIV